MSVHADCAGYDSVGRVQALAENEGLDERFHLKGVEKLALRFWQAGTDVGKGSFDD
jgi:hypothetical protein